MPLYNYKCDKCEIEFSKLISAKEFSPQTNVSCECGGDGKFKLPSSVHSRAYETTNKYSGKTRIVGVDKMVQERYRKHLYTYEAGQIIDMYGVKDGVAQDLMKNKVKK